MLVNNNSLKKKIFFRSQENLLVLEINFIQFLLLCKFILIIIIITTIVLYIFYYYIIIKLKIIIY